MIDMQFQRYCDDGFPVSTMLQHRICSFNNITTRNLQFQRFFNKKSRTTTMSQQGICIANYKNQPKSVIWEMSLDLRYNLRTCGVQYAEYEAFRIALNLCVKVGLKLSEVMAWIKIYSAMTVKNGSLSLSTIWSQNDLNYHGSLRHSNQG
ncbi:hypothetical protein TNCV_1913221 [Trichonephila clavipes]|nr:hypothetical protein TNCV_1913221 [Trichonephila clavipes]